MTEEIADALTEIAEELKRQNAIQRAMLEEYIHQHDKNAATGSSADQLAEELLTRAEDRLQNRSREEDT